MTEEEKYRLKCNNVTNFYNATFALANLKWKKDGSPPHEEFKFWKEAENEMWYKFGNKILEQDNFK